MAATVWELAVAEARRRRNGNEEISLSSIEEPKEVTMLFVGSRGAGKTTLINKFLDHKDPSSETLALEYTYGRKSGKSVSKDIKDVCHIWELGGGPAHSSLLTPILTLNNIKTMTIFLVVDLSQVNILWRDMETLLKEIELRVAKLLSSNFAKEKNVKETLMDAAWNRVGKDHFDKDNLSPFPIPLVIIGGKYDIFERVPIEQKKAVCKALRYVAHTRGATLHFFSAKDSGLVNKAKDLLGHYGFDIPERKNISQDFNKPLFIPAGHDTFVSIIGSGEGESANKEAWYRNIVAEFPQEISRASILPDDPTHDSNYKEVDIDNLRRQKDEELEKLLREVGNPSSNYQDIDIE